MKKILIGTHNKGKFKEISYLLSKKIKVKTIISLYPSVSLTTYQILRNSIFATSASASSVLMTPWQETGHSACRFQPLLNLLPSMHRTIWTVIWANWVTIWQRWFRKKIIQEARDFAVIWGTSHISKVSDCFFRKQTSANGIYEESTTIRSQYQPRKMSFEEADTFLTWTSSLKNPKTSRWKNLLILLIS